jgi:hypothetical protein
VELPTLTGSVSGDGQPRPRPTIRDVAALERGSREEAGVWNPAHRVREPVPTAPLAGQNLLTTGAYPDLDLEAAVDRILGAGVRIVVATLGAQGALGASNSVRVRVAAPTVKVVDTIGASDFFGAALLAWLHDHEAPGTDVVLGADELKCALVFACLVASLTCTRAGAEPPWRAELGDDLSGSLGTRYK